MTEITSAIGPAAQGCRPATICQADPTRSRQSATSSAGIDVRIGSV